MQLVGVAKVKELSSVYECCVDRVARRVDRSDCSGKVREMRESNLLFPPLWNPPPKHATQQIKRERASERKQKEENVEGEVVCMCVVWVKALKSVRSSCATMRASSGDRSDRSGRRAYVCR